MTVYKCATNNKRKQYVQICYWLCISDIKLGVNIYVRKRCSTRNLMGEICLHQKCVFLHHNSFALLVFEIPSITCIICFKKVKIAPKKILFLYSV